MFFLIAEFAYNNLKNISISYIFLKLNFNYHPNIYYKKEIDFYSKSKSADKLSIEL